MTEIEKRKLRCTQCRKSYFARACGPAHALIMRDLVDPFHPAALRRLRQRVARVLRGGPPYALAINAAIDAWAANEIRRRAV